ncbi:hypothetical protein TrLO_g3865 [Triparma laevis f. longispina]|uniref:Uncharacterized protein n=1 Tax=Triparma laevis f. longispina TaxID=1714387 RepID=A0A9W7AFI7_9STRA|nr:hypothetical protein TrLO_g3865 [Triparma laevis f. longispina]
MKMKPFLKFNLAKPYQSPRFAMNNIASTVESSIASAEAYLTSTTISPSSPPLPPPPPSRSLPLHPQSPPLLDDSMDLKPNPNVNATLSPDPLAPPSPANSHDSLNASGVKGGGGEGEEGELYFASDINHKNPTAASWEVTFAPSAPTSLKPKPVLKTKKERPPFPLKPSQKKLNPSKQPSPPPAPSFTLSRPAQESLNSVLAEETFQPVITSKGVKMRSNSNVHDRLTAYGVNADQKRDSAHTARLEVLREQEKKQHPFQPHVTSKGRAALQPDRVQDRLYKLAGERDVVRECTKYHMMEAEVGRYSFRPEVNEGFNERVVGEEYKPIYERANEVVKKKQENLNVLRSSIEATSGVTWTASGSSISTGDGTAHQRLHSEAARQVENAIKRQTKFEEVEKESNTFKPKLCRGTEERTESYGNKPFLERQKDYVGNVEIKKLIREEKEADQFKGYFKPDIGQSENVLMKRRPEVVCESESERVVRLAVTEKEEMESRREERVVEEYNRYTFEPEINNISRALGGAQPFSIEQLNKNERGKAIREKVKKQAEETFKSECTFKPNVQKKRVSRTNKTKVDEGEPRQKAFQLNLSNPEDLTLQVTRYNEAKETERQTALREREMKELEECTFKPRTNHAAKAKPVNGSNDENKAQGGGYMSQHNAKKSKAPVVVRGLGRYLELKKLAAQKAAAQDARERKAFNVRGQSNKAKYPDGTTQVKEFRLSKNPNKKEKVRIEREKKLREQCTFRPDTVERRNREVLRAVLAEE